MVDFMISSLKEGQIYERLGDTGRMTVTAIKKDNLLNVNLPYYIHLNKYTEIYYGYDRWDRWSIGKHRVETTEIRYKYDVKQFASDIIAGQVKLVG
jgi:hypothetical protein